MSNPIEFILTPAECATLAAMSSGNTAKVVARQLGISHRTIEAHMHQAMKRMGAKNRIQALIAYDRATRQDNTGASA